jgi:hypothetical protein
MFYRKSIGIIKHFLSECGVLSKLRNSIFNEHAKNLKEIMQYLGFIEQSTEIKMQILLDITMLNKAQQIKKITLIITNRIA